MPRYHYSLNRPLLKTRRQLRDAMSEKIANYLFGIAMVAVVAWLVGSVIIGMK